MNEERLLKHPAIIEKLYMNKATRMSTADRMIELAVRNGLELNGIPAFKEAAAAIADELIAEPTEEPTPDDVLFKELDEEAEQIESIRTRKSRPRDEETGDEVIVEKVLPLHAKLASMSISQKIRRAMLGTGGERMLLVPRQEQARRRRSHPQPEDPGERNRAASRRAGTFPTRCCGSSPRTRPGCKTTRSS